MTSMIVYERTQSQNVYLVGFVAYLAIVALIAGAVGESPWVVIVPSAIVAVPIGLILAGASALRVTVTTTEVYLRWRFGWPHKTIERSDIVSAGQVRNKWWYGWGIRLTPNGWMWNIWGLDAVKVERASGKGFVIGTDDPEGLLAALG